MLTVLLLSFVQRFVFDFIPKAGEAEERTFDARGLNRLDAWHLLQIAVDPPYQGKGESPPSRTASIVPLFRSSEIFFFS